MENEEIGKEFIFFKPEYVGRWSYQIDNGRKHMLREENVYPYAKGFLKDSKEWSKVVDIISRHQPFMVFIEKKEAKELHPSTETRDYHRNRIAEDLSGVMKGIETQGTILGNNSHTLRINSRREDYMDSFLKGYIRKDQRNTLSDSILDSKLK